MISTENPYLIASVLAFLTSLKTRHLMLTVVVGLVTFSLCRFVL
jgi:branched-subunit amino acid transport protein